MYRIFILLYACAMVLDCVYEYIMWRTALLSQCYVFLCAELGLYVCASAYNVCMHVDIDRLWSIIICSDTQRILCYTIFV